MIRRVRCDSHCYSAPVGSGVLRSGCLSVREHISGTGGTIFTKFFCADPLWPWLVRPLAACDTGAESDVYECLVKPMTDAR